MSLQTFWDVKSFILYVQGTGLRFTFTGSTIDLVEIAIRNAWLDILLQAITTGNPVIVRWADNDADGQGNGLGGFGKGNLVAIDGLK